LLKQPVAPGHAEAATHGATHLGRHTHASARQEHRLDGACISEGQKQAARTIFARVFGNEAHQCLEAVAQPGMRFDQGMREEVLGPSAPRPERRIVQPSPQEPILVLLTGAECRQNGPKSTPMSKVRLDQVRRAGRCQWGVQTGIHGRRSELSTNGATAALSPYCQRSTAMKSNRSTPSRSSLKDRLPRILGSAPSDTEARDKGPKTQDAFEVWHHHAALRRPAEWDLLLAFDQRR
jgi:hypothetical protein